MFRYWDGTSWSATLSPSPSAPAGPPLPGQVPLSGGTPLKSRAAPAAYAQPPRRTGGSIAKNIGWALLILMIVAALIFGALQVLRGFGLNPLDPPVPANPTINPCPPEPLSPETPVAHPNDGRVHGGKLSYPLLGSPWGSPEGDSRLPFGRDVQVQSVMVEPNYNGTYSWVASVLVGELIAGDGFFSPKEATELITRCAMQRFYSDAIVTRDDKASRSVTVSGKPGWLIETHLSFDIQGLKVKGETAIFVVVQTSDTSSSIFYASIPDSVPELLTAARQVQTQLRIDP